uniref:Uncharacterized protein n=1 Tax=Arundo donax TaxID=35708 RepID=A0A0A9H7W6_ARUDO
MYKCLYDVLYSVGSSSGFIFSFPSPSFLAQLRGEGFVK